MFPPGSTGKPVRIYIDLAVSPDGSVGMAGPPVLSWEADVPGVGAIQQSVQVVDTALADVQAMGNLIHAAISDAFTAAGVTLAVPPPPPPPPPPAAEAPVPGMPGAPADPVAAAAPPPPPAA